VERAILADMNMEMPTSDRPVKAAGSGEGRRLLAQSGLAVVVTSLMVAVVSFLVLMGLTPIRPTEQITTWLAVVNGVLILILIGLIIREVRRILTARKNQRAAARLHVRIVALFSLVAAVPAVAVALVAAFTLNVGLDRWFEVRTKEIVSSSINIAQSYVEENARNLQGTTLSMAVDLDAARTLYSLDRRGFQELFDRQSVGRGLVGASLVRSDGEVLLKANTNTDLDLPAVPIEVVKTAEDGKPVLIPPRTRNLVGAVLKLKEIEGAFLYTIRTVDPELIKAVQIVQANTAEYNGLEANRTLTQIAFALLYLGLTLVVLLSAIWTGIAVADRLVRPIRLLIGAADDVAQGNLEVEVPVRRSDGDVASLSGTFNNMIYQLKSQRNELMSAKDQIDERRRFSEAVLGGVSAGIIGIDPDGLISIINKPAEQLMGVEGESITGQKLSVISPEIGAVFERARGTARSVYNEQVAIHRRGLDRTLNVKITMEEGPSRVDHSYVVTLDDITDLMTAQRSSAWADIARRIAHEIKNPLTPIQLSAERIRRRYGKVITEDREVFDQCVDTIVRQVGDIGRMVDEFSGFARMPAPTFKPLDLREPLGEAIFLIEVSRPEIKFERQISDQAILGSYDHRMLGQAFGNIIKNAAEAIESRLSEDSSEAGHIVIRANISGAEIVVDVMDNGKGLPRENRQRLLEPYMTTREKGTGLGLAIVKKIVEDHHGSLTLMDADNSFYGGRGALIRMIFPQFVASTATLEPDFGGKKLPQEKPEMTAVNELIEHGR
jgi:two-component system, NtrC family, nitrogen regulation sensor histidine kinase NtrY